MKRERQHHVNNLSVPLFCRPLVSVPLFRADLILEADGHCKNGVPEITAATIRVDNSDVLATWGIGIEIGGVQIGSKSSLELEIGDVVPVNNEVVSGDHGCSLLKATYKVTWKAKATYGELLGESKKLKQGAVPFTLIYECCVCK